MVRIDLRCGEHLLNPLVDMLILPLHISNLGIHHSHLCVDHLSLSIRSFILRLGLEFHDLGIVEALLFLETDHKLLHLGLKSFVLLSETSLDLSLFNDQFGIFGRRLAGGALEHLRNVVNPKGFEITCFHSIFVVPWGSRGGLLQPHGLLETHGFASHVRVGDWSDHAGVALVIRTGSTVSLGDAGRQEGRVELIQLGEFLFARAPDPLEYRGVDLLPHLHHRLHRRSGGVLARILPHCNVRRATDARGVINQE